MTLSRPRSPKTRAQSKVDTRRRLLDSAREVITSVGYQGATLDEIAARAGFTKGALYWHFPNKQAVFVALVADSIDRNLQFLSDLTADGAEPDGVKARFAEWIDGIDQRETLPQFGIELEIEARHDPSFRAIHEAMVGKHEDALEAFFERYYTLVGGHPELPIKDLAGAVITILKGYALARQNRPGTELHSGKVIRVLMGLPLQ